MTLRITATTISLCSALFAVPALAQEQATEQAPAAAAQAQQPSQPVLVATHTDWQILCSQPQDGAQQNCEMYQLLTDENNNPMGEISILALPFGAEFAAGATVTTPLETFLPTGLGFVIGNAEEMRMEPFRVCTVVGCFVRMGLSSEEVNALKAGATATVAIAPYVAIDQAIQMTISLSGFTAAYDDLQNRLAEAAAAAREN